MERTTTVILSEYKGRRAVHFTDQPLAGKNGNLWFPVDNKDLKDAINDIMEFNDITNNVITVTTTGKKTQTSMEIGVTFLAKI